MDDPVADRVHLARRPDRPGQGRAVDPPAGALDLLLGQRPVGAVEEAQLEAAGARVDGEDPQG
jgi:hypothetical protein